MEGPDRQAPQAVTLITPSVYLSGFRQDRHLLPPGSQPGGFLLDQCSSQPRRARTLSCKFSACFYAHSQVSASLHKPDAWPCSSPPSRRHSSHTCITLALPSQFWLKKASAAKFSTKHSKLLCSSSHMILPFKGSKNKTNFQHSITTFKIIHF